LQVKKLITRLLAFLVRSIGHSFVAVRLATYIIKPIASVLHIPFLKLFVLPIFGRYVWLKNKLSRRATAPLDKLLLLATNRYLAPIIILLITGGVILSNIYTEPTNEDTGRNALVYKIIGLENIELIEDATPITESTTFFSYADTATQVSRRTFTESQRRDEEDVNQVNSLAVTQDGTVFVKPGVATTENSESTRTTVRDYIVQEGDSIGKIATNFNITVNTILWANNLTFNSYIKPGQKLLIPPTSGVMHTIVRGDTLTKIAQKYDATEKQIGDFNNVENEGLVVGQRIMVPGGRIIETAKPRQPASAIASAPAGRSSSSSVEPAAPAGTSGMIWPSSCRRISQYYRGWLHTGVDIACPFGTPIRAAEGGVVSLVQYSRTGYGYHVIINHGGGIQTLYGHMSTISVKAGQRVSRGETIGLEGSTGRSTGPHLHFEVRINGAKANPLSYVR
jgi:LysM repeat protein